MFLHDYNSHEFGQYKNELSKAFGNILIQLALPVNSKRPEQKQLEHIVVSFKSKVLQTYVQGWPLQFAEFDYLNFYFHYIEMLLTTDKCYQMRFLTDIYEMQQFKNNSGYTFKSIKENKFIYDITTDIDQMIIVVNFKGMYFLYIIWISANKCFLLDVQENARERLPEHRQIVKELLKKQYDINRNQDVNCILLKEIKFNKEQSKLARAGLILDLVNKYINNIDDIYKIDRFTISLQDGTDLLDKITWFVYKAYKEKFYVVYDRNPPNQIIENKNTNLTYNTWEKQFHIDESYREYDDQIARKQAVQNQFQKNGLKNDQKVWLQDKAANMEANKFHGIKPHLINDDSSSFFSKLAHSQVISPIDQQFLQQEEPAKKYTIQQSVRLNQLRDSSKSKIDDSKQRVKNDHSKSLGVNSFLKEAQVRDLPQQRHVQLYQSYAPQQDSLQKSKENVSRVSSQERITLTRDELKNLLEQAKQEIKEDLKEQFDQQLKQSLQQQPKYSKIDEEIADEYMSQVKFKKYQDYMQYLLSYYYNYQPDQYQWLLDQYHQRMAAYAIEGLTGLQKKEMLKLIAVTEEKIKQQNQNLDIVNFNQKKILEKTKMTKKEINKAQQEALLEELKKQQKPRYEFQFSMPQEVNPYQFKEEILLPQQKEDENRVKMKYDLEDVDLDENQINQMYSYWDFNAQERKHQLQKQKELMEQKALDEQDSFEEEKKKMEEEMNKYRNLVKKDPNNQNEDPSSKKDEDKYSKNSRQNDLDEEYLNFQKVEQQFDLDKVRMKKLRQSRLERQSNAQNIVQTEQLNQSKSKVDVTHQSIQ